MALPLSIFDKHLFPQQAWQSEEAADLVAGAQRDLYDKRYEACRRKCNLALSYAHLWFETRLAAYIELAFALEDWGGVRAARSKAQRLLDEAFPAYDPFYDLENNAWLRHQHALLHELKIYEYKLKSDRDRQRPAYLTLIKKQSSSSPSLNRTGAMGSINGTVGSSASSLLAARGHRRAGSVESDALRDSIVTELLVKSSEQRLPLIEEDLDSSPRGIDRLLVNVEIGRCIR